MPLQEKCPLTAALLATAVILAGCGPQIEPAAGVVTLDGEPLADAFISFMPIGEEGEPGFSKTDAHGSYEVVRGSNETGLVPGDYIVRISTFVEGKPDAYPPIPEIPERVPARYNAHTELRATVAADSPSLSFDLKSE